ncbi:MAG: HD domain-containing protein [Oscillospiraceae bacterium]|jgi:uncharacterized protein|nr:HD domain-containing protein [Oscillospiraceae bacterium]
MSYAWQTYCKARLLAAGEQEDAEPEYMRYIVDLLATPEFKSLEVIPHHIPTTLLTHVRCVSYVAYSLCRRYGGDSKIAARGGLLHDLYYYDWHDFSDKSHRWHGVLHPSRALKNACLLLGEVDKRTADCIHRHMFPFTPIPPIYRESIMVSLSDKICANFDVLIARFSSVRRRFEHDTELHFN